MMTFLNQGEIVFTYILGLAIIFASQEHILATLLLCGHDPVACWSAKVTEAPVPGLRTSAEAIKGAFGASSGEQMPRDTKAL